MFDRICTYTLIALAWCFVLAMVLSLVYPFVGALILTHL